VITKKTALVNATRWAQRAEDAAQEYPHTSSTDTGRMFQATDMADMWSKLASALDGLEMPSPEGL
jgi:hypothetical protein